MNTTTYKPARILGGSRLLDAIEADEANKAALRQSIRKMNIFVPDDLLYSLEADQLELILQYRDYRVVDRKEWSDDRNFVTDKRGRSFMPTAEMNDAKYLKFRDAKILSQIKDYRAFKRVIITMDEETNEDRKSNKIDKILDTVDPKYHAIVSLIKRDYMEVLVDLTLDKYEPTIRRYLAGMLRGLGREFGQHISIQEACEALGLDTTKQMLSILEELREANLYNSTEVTLDSSAMTTQVRNILFNLKSESIIDEQHIDSILSYLDTAIEFIQPELCKLTYRPDMVVTLLLLQRHQDVRIRSFLTKMSQIGLIDGKEEMIATYQTYSRMDRKEVTDTFRGLNFTNYSDEEVVHEETVDDQQEENLVVSNTNSKDINSIPSEIENETEVIHKIINEEDPTSQATYKYYTINASIAGLTNQYIMGSSDHQDVVIRQLKNHLRTGVRIDVADPFADTWIYWKSNDIMPVGNATISILDIDIHNHFPGLPTDHYELTMGMKGEVIRDIIQHSKNQPTNNFYLITAYDRVILRKFTSYLRHNKYRLKPIDPRIELVKHKLTDLNDLDEIQQIITRKFEESEEGNTAIIHDIRGLFYNPDNLVSLLDNELEPALREYSQHIIKNSKKRILKHELRDILYNYKDKYEKDKILIGSGNTTKSEILQIKLDHLPRLHPVIKQSLNRYRKIAIMYAHSSKAISGQPGDEKINPQWDSELEIAIDRLILDTFQYVRIISSRPNDHYNTHGDLVQTQILLDSLPNDWEDFITTIADGTQITKPSQQQITGVN